MYLEIKNRIKSISEQDEYNLRKLYDEIKKEIENVEYLDYLFYSLKKYEYREIEKIEEICETKEEKIKRLDKIFRENVISRDIKCIITGKSRFVCEVAHIYPFSKCTMEEKYDENNGILICRDLHKLFDDKLITINPDNNKLKLSDEILNDETLEIYHKYNNKKLNIKKESSKYLRKLYE